MFIPLKFENNNNIIFIYPFAQYLPIFTYKEWLGGLEIYPWGGCPLWPQPCHSSVADPLQQGHCLVGQQSEGTDFPHPQSPPLHCGLGLPLHALRTSVSSWIKSSQSCQPQRWHFRCAPGHLVNVTVLCSEPPVVLHLIHSELIMYQQRLGAICTRALGEAGCITRRSVHAVGKQPAGWEMCLGHLAGQRQPGPQPSSYDFWSPRMEALLSWK